MQHMGVDGYLESCATIVGAAKRLILGIQRDFSPDELHVLGEPLVSVVAFTSASLQIYEIGDVMSKKGWHLNALQHPPALHIACTKLTAAEGVIESLLRDLRAAVDEVKMMDKPGGGSMVMLCESQEFAVNWKQIADTSLTLLTDGLGSSSAVGPGLVEEMASRCESGLYKGADIIDADLVHLMLLDMDVVS